MITVCVPSAVDRDALQPVPDGVRLIAWDGRGDPPADAADTAFFVPGYGGPAAKAMVEHLPQLRVIQLLTAGVEGWLPFVPDGVTLCNARGVHGGSTAELCVTGILATVRRLPRFLDCQRAHDWAPEDTEDLDEKRLLVLGAGDIGRRVAAALEVFGVRTTFVGHTKREGVHGIDELARLVPDADIVALTLPLTDETRGLVDAAFLRALPDGAIVANIARGAVLDTDALLAELQAGRLRAVLDVTDPEPLPEDHPLWSAPNLILTPHVGGGTSGWQRRAHRLLRDQIRRYAASEPLANVVSGAY